MAQKQKNKSVKSKKAKKPKTSSSEKKHSGFFRFCYWTLVIGIWGAIALACYIAYILFTMPQFSTWKVPVRPPNIHIVDRNGILIANRGLTGGEAIHLEDMSPYLPHAVIAIEDRRFYEHNGLDPLGVGRALMRNFISPATRQGGSTLTQQLAKNLFLSSEQTIARKSREALLAFWLEYKFTKQQILEMYLNRVYLGSGAYGVEAAAHRYFNKTAQNLTLQESAIIAGLLKAPSRLSPAHDPKAAVERAHLVLDAMLKEKTITQAQYNQAIQAPLPRVPSYWSGSENYVADYIVHQIPFLIGRVDKDITVKTTLDMRMQRAGEKAIRREVLRYKNRNVSQAALVSIDTNGGISAMIGGANYAKSQYNRAVDAHRQPGSAFKPFVYLTALEQGRTPNSVRNDAPIKIGNWTPKNAGGKYMGRVTLTTALSHSLNSVAAQLAMEVGTKSIIATAHRLGIHSGLSKDASLALGTSEVSLLELTGAYLPFAAGGIKPQVHLINQITDNKGYRLYNIGKVDAPRLIQPRIVAMMNTMLEQTILNGTASRANIGRPAAGKTGTSQNFRDAWFVGYTTDFVTGVWFGNDDGTSMRRIGGGGLPVSVWRSYMLAAEKGRPAMPLPGNYLLKNAIPGGSDLPQDTQELPANKKKPEEEKPELAPFSIDSVPNNNRASGQHNKRGILDILRGR